MNLGESILERNVRLPELIDRMTLAETLLGLSAFSGLPISVFDENCDLYAGTLQDGDALPREIIAKMRKSDPSAGDRAFSDKAGFSYQLKTIEVQGDDVGFLLAGPYRASAADQAGLNSERQIELATKSALRIVEALLYTGLKSLFTGQMHVESIEEAYRALEEKNRSLLESHERLQELSEVKSNFLQTVSHELKTPLTSILGYTEMMCEGLAGSITDEQREYLSTILAKGRQLLNMINSVLDIAHMGSARSDMEISLHQPRFILETAIEEQKDELEERKCSVTTAIEEQLPDVAVDISKISRAVAAILNNAIKFSPDGSAIDIRVRQREQKRSADSVPGPFELPERPMLVIEIADHGIGIHGDDLDSVFNSFFQVDNSATRQFGGVGLGLTVARNFVEAHGGTIEVESALSKGSCFRIVLPLQPPSPADPQAGEH